MIYELVLRNFNCIFEFVFSLLLLQPFNFSPVSFDCNIQDRGCVILREIDFLLKFCWAIPCLHPSWKVHTWIEICASLNHRKNTKADGSRLIPRKHTETPVLLSVISYLTDILQQGRKLCFYCDQIVKIRLFSVVRPQIFCFAVQPFLSILKNCRVLA